MQKLQFKYNKAWAKTSLKVVVTQKYKFKEKDSQDCNGVFSSSLNFLLI